jgi:Ca2+-binding RTX toxin-like protein
MMSHLYIEGKPTLVYSDSGTGPGDTFPISAGAHLLLVYVDDANKEWIIRGGREGYDDEPYGHLDLQIDQELMFSKDLYQIIDGQMETNATRGRREIDLEGRNPDDIWQVLIEHANNIQNNHYAYDPTGSASPDGLAYNSNGVVSNLLSLIGIDVSLYQPIISGVQIGGYYGQDTKFVFQHDISGTQNNDYVFSDDTQTRFLMDDYTSDRGFDTVSFANLKHSISVDLGNGIVSNGDVIQGVDRIIGTDFADRFDAPEGTYQQSGTENIIITAGGGNDRIDVRGNSMTVYGDSGDDSIHVNGYLGEINQIGSPGGLYPGYYPGFPTPAPVIPNYIVHGGDDYDRMILNESVGGRGQTVTIESGSGTIGSLMYDGIEELVFDAMFIDINGGSNADIIRGGTVSSTIHGKGGNDVIYSRGSARDYIFGDDGNDFLYGDNGDEIHGGSGNDTINAGDDIGQAYLYGDSGSDKIYGGRGNDVIYGGSGNDTIYGGDGEDYFNLNSSEGSLVSVTNQGSFFEVTTSITTGYEQDSSGNWIATRVFETDKVYDCEYLFVDGRGWELTPEFLYPNF